ncbi:MAG: threonylcarbamoyl-AMP synthase [Ottowia sp.]|nr:threonylcarbamoyl-AMP synthase [Ottowia sp.]
MPIFDASSQDAIERAADALAAGDVVAIPTETVYGPAVDAAQPQAVRRLFALKERPAAHPLPVLVADAAAAQHFAASVPPAAEKLMAAFWPGALTLVLPRKEGVVEEAAGGQANIALRCSAHPVVQRLLAACAARGIAGLACPSANRFGRISSTTAAHVAAEFGDELPVLDGGACSVGIESSIVDCTKKMLVLLRPGAVAREAIERTAGAALVGRDALSKTAAEEAQSGHYAPRAKVRLMDGKALKTGLELLGAQAKNIAVWARDPMQSASRQLVLRRMPDDALAAARELFAVLRGFDDAGVKLIWVQEPPAGSEWDAVRDRLHRAAAAQ